MGTHPVKRAHFNEWIAADDQWGFILEMHGHPLGYGEVWFDFVSEDIEIAHVVISPEWRHQGYGKLLVERLRHCGSQFRSWPLFIRVDPDNLAARRLYAQIGYQRLSPLGLDCDPRWIWFQWPARD